MFEEIVNVLGEYTEVPADEITESSRFIDDLSMNSYNIMSAVGAMEDEFDIEVNEKDVADIRTVGDVVKYIEKLTGGQL